MTSNTYHVGRGSASGQYSIVDGQGKVVGYADSRADAEEAVRNLIEQETETMQWVSKVNPLQLYKGYRFEKDHGYKGTFRDYEREVAPGLYSSSGFLSREEYFRLVNDSRALRDGIKDGLEAAGFECHAVDSKKSESSYLYVRGVYEPPEVFKVRVSDGHENYMAPPDYQVEVGTDVAEAVQGILSIIQSSKKSYTDLYSGGKDGLIVSTLKELTEESLQLIQQNEPTLWHKLNTEIGDDERLKFRYKAVLHDGNLLDLLKRALGAMVEYRGYKAFLVLAGDSPIGFIGYHLSESIKTLSNLKTYSFKDVGGNNTVIWRELRKIVFRHVGSYNIQWVAEKGHENEPVYKAILASFGKEPQEDPHNPSVLVYTIPAGSVQKPLERRSKAVEQVPQRQDNTKSSSSDGSSVLLTDGVNSENCSNRIKSTVFKKEVGVTSGASVSNKKENNADIIWSATAQELLDGNNSDKFRRTKHLAATKAQGDSEIMRCFASTVELRTRSENFDTNKTFYRQWVLFKDFKSIARDKKIKLEDAADYALNFCDVTVRCSCPSQLYHGFSYMGDQLGYLYGIPRESRYPGTTNPDLENTTCKHVHMALEHLLQNKEKLIKMFSVYYKRLGETPPDTMIAIPTKAVEEGDEEDVDEFMAAFGEEVPEEHKIEPEVISKEEEGTGTVHVDTKMAEGLLPPEQQVKYAGDEDNDKSAVAENVADEVTEEEVNELEDEILEADTGKPRNENEKYMHEWSFQRFRRDKDYTPILSAETHAKIRSSVVPNVRMVDPVVQNMVNEVNVVLRQVDETYFPKFQFEKAVVDGDRYYLFYDAFGKHMSGKHFSLKAILGTNGFISGVAVQSLSGVNEGPLVLSDSVSLREYLNRIGFFMSGRR